jgi:hypothetical protein
LVIEIPPSDGKPHKKAESLPTLLSGGDTVSVQSGNIMYLSAVISREDLGDGVKDHSEIVNILLYCA